MKCWICGEEIHTVNLDFFQFDGSNKRRSFELKEDGDSATIDIDDFDNWCGADDLEEYQRFEIHCPSCDFFPFRTNEIQKQEITRLTFFGINGPSWSHLERIKS